MSGPRKGSLSWKLLNDDWSDLTTDQIAEVLGVKPDAVKNAMMGIRRKYGFRVRHKRTRTRTPSNKRKE